MPSTSFNIPRKSIDSNITPKHNKGKEERSRIRKRKSTLKIENKMKPIQKLKRTIRKIKLALRFLESTYGSVKTSTDIDLYKDKYLGVLSIYFTTIKESFKCKFRTGFLLLSIDVLRLAMKIPDLSALKH